jgi:hypothetical protein
MTFDHEYISKNNLIEDYLLGILPEEDEGAFEEHLLTCEVCRTKLLQTEKILDGLKHIAGEFPVRRIPEAGKIKNPSFSKFLRIAAIVLFAALIPGLYVYIKNSTRISENKVANRDEITQKGPSSVVDSTEETGKQKTDIKTITPKQANKSEFSKDTLLQYLAYEPSPVMENAIGEMVRGANVSVRTPAISDVFKKNETIVFNWIIPDRSSARFVLKNNRGTTLVNENVFPPVRKHLKEAGLYYWQLIIDDDVIYTGKIIVNE